MNKSKQSRDKAAGTGWFGWSKRVRAGAPERNNLGRPDHIVSTEVPSAATANNLDLGFPKVKHLVLWCYGRSIALSTLKSTLPHD